MSSDETQEPAQGEMFTCANCGATHEKGWSDEEAAAEAEENFPGIDVSDPDEAPVVCDDCYQRIMARARVEAPEMIGPGWRGEAQASDDPIGDALRADAEAARAEIRGTGLICPSCGVNMADLPDGHLLVLLLGEYAECADGERVNLLEASFEVTQAAANIAVWDAFRKREAEAFRAIVGDGRGDFTGLLGILQGEEPKR